MSNATTTTHPALRSCRGLSEQARQILDRRPYAVLGTENDDGSVHLAPVMVSPAGRPDGEGSRADVAAIEALVPPPRA